jgi:hypothetical protein
LQILEATEIALSLLHGVQGIWDSLSDVFLEALLTDKSQEVPERMDALPVPTQPSADARLHGIVLDCLCDTVLAACGPAELSAKERLVSVIDGASASSNIFFGTDGGLASMALQKLYALCSRAEPKCHGVTSVLATFVSQELASLSSVPGTL